MTSADLAYLGALRTPEAAFHYTSGPMSLDWQRGELVLFTRDRRVGRLTLRRPEKPAYLTNTKLLDPLSVPVAPLADPVVVDPSGGTWGEVNNPDVAVGDGPEGIQVLGDYALVSGSIYYDANTSQDRALFLSPWPLTAPGRAIWRAVQGIGQGWVSGPITIIPEKWRAAFKGDVLTGQPGGLPIISRQSFGPAAIALHAEDLLTMPEVPATLLLGYREGQGWPWSGPANDFWNSSTAYNAITFVGDDVVFIGRHGYGKACYGTGAECGDPANSSKGTHAYPYRVQAIGYHAQELADVAAGKLKPYEPKPFWFPLEFPIFDHPYYKLPAGATPMVDVIGAEYDSLTGELYVGVAAQDSLGYEPGPLIHVFSVKGIVRTPHPTVAIDASIPEPSNDVERLRRELEETKAQLDVVEAQRIQLASDYQDEVADHADTTARLTNVLDTVRQVTSGLDRLWKLKP